MQINGLEPSEAQLTFAVKLAPNRMKTKAAEDGKTLSEQDTYRDTLHGAVGKHRSLRHISMQRNHETNLQSRFVALRVHVIVPRGPNTHTKKIPRTRNSRTVR